MSDTVVIDDPSVTRVPMRDRANRATERAGGGEEVPKFEVGDDAPGNTPSPEDEIAGIAKSLERSQADTRAAEQRAQEQAAENGRLQRELARQRQNTAASRATSLQHAIDSSAAQVAAAEAAYLTALENADPAGQVKAQKELAVATTRHTMATTALQGAKEGSDPASAAGAMEEPGQTRQQPAAGAIDPKSQAWIDAHPKFKTHTGYRDAILKAHADATDSGVMPNTPAYFRELDRVAAVLDGGKGAEGGDQMGNEGGGRRETFGGARSAGPSNGANGGARTVRTALGAVTVGRKADGTVTLKVDPSVASDFKEGASICGMDYGEYVYEQVKIADEQANGGSSDLTYTENRTYR